MQQKRYWLRGGIILGLIALILISAVILYEYSVCTSNYEGLCGLYTLIITMPISGIFGIFLSGNLLGSHLLTYSIIGLGGIIFWFLIGSILGWLYGKIKNSKS